MAEAQGMAEQGGVGVETTRTAPARIAGSASLRRGRPSHAPTRETSIATPAVSADAVAAAWRGWARQIRWNKGKRLIRRPLLRARAVLWPVICARTALVQACRFGGAARAQGGPSIVRQIIYHCFLATRYGFHGADYYKFRLFLPERARVAGRFVHEQAALPIVRRVNDVRDAKVLGDKQRFAEACERFGLPHVRVLAHFEEGRLVSGALRGGEDLFVKCTRLNCGHGVELWRWNGAESTFAHDNERLRAPELAARVAELSRSVPAGGNGTTWHGSDGKLVVESRPYIVQPRARNHPVLAAFSDGPLCTVRLVTMRRRGGSPRFGCAVLRMPGGCGSSVDNFNSGGLAAPIDGETGALGHAISKDCAVPPTAKHPNGAAIVGRRLPFWTETIALCERAHECFAEISSAGWDVGLTPAGPILLEANYSWDCDILQMAHGRPISEMPLGPGMLTHFT